MIRQEPSGPSRSVRGLRQLIESLIPSVASPVTTRITGFAVRQVQTHTESSFPVATSLTPLSIS